ncbi:MAG: glucose-1-phosphate thymidylyltransferase [Chloroflexota bacterium]|nr:glucose-1-phosphate thymidylyltransferase [Chloroflexota bacterium]
MKAIVLCAGKATRLRPLTNTRAKPLVPVANKPILLHLIEQITDAGIFDIGIVVSPETGPQVKQLIGNSCPSKSEITYILQLEPLGLAHAVIMSQDFLTDSSFLMFLGDNLIEGGVKDFVTRFTIDHPDASIMLKEVPNPCAFGVAELDDSGQVIGLEEKPKKPKSNLILVGAYLFTPEIHQFIAQISPSKRGELEITDAIQKLLASGKDVRSYTLSGRWLDIGNKEDLLMANAFLLQQHLDSGNQGSIDSMSQITDPVLIGAGTTIENCTIKGPTIIAEGCHLKDSSIGPLVSLGANTHIEHSTMDNSMILGGCHFAHLKHLTNSVIGKNTEIMGNSDAQAANTLVLFLGDDSKIHLSKSTES